MPECEYCLDVQFVYTGECRVVPGVTTKTMETLFQPCQHCCQHHWVVDSPNGNEALAGRCKRCHATREFTPNLDREWRAWVSPHQMAAL